MKTYTISEGKAQLSKLVESVVSGGEPITLGRGAKPEVQIVPFVKPKECSRLGDLEGKTHLPDNWDEWDDETARALHIID